jgi:hypothetical protein
LRAGTRIGGSNRVSIANRPIERRIIPVADNIMRQNSPQRLPQGKRFGLRFTGERR